MKIEILCQETDSTKDKGDLLEDLSNDLLQAQNFTVIQEIRVTGAELDLLCKHKVNGKEIYVECKAQTGKIGAPILRQLNGTVDAYDYAEGWLISTSEFGKEAKGFVEMWQKKPVQKSSKLSFYTPEKVIECLVSASIIKPFPMAAAITIAGDPSKLGDWSLIVSKFGRYWCVYTLRGGAPFGVLFFNAFTGEHIKDEETIHNLSTLDASFNDYDIHVGLQGSTVSLDKAASGMSASVVEVQTGDSWTDYRPARPEDFIGRDEVQKDILSFFGNVKEKDTTTRIFAITGNSGMGKSSLIAKVRDRSRNKFYKNKFFTFAVDMRGAKTPSYISASLLRCLKNAQRNGFGDDTELTITDPNAPLSSESISKFLASVEAKEQVIALIFDQFEELYSKTELYSVFRASRELFLNVASFQGNIVLGFAWKTDSTTQQDHPAYHLWHQLSDHRREYKLEVFDKGEIAKSITSFEKELGSNIPIEVRSQISHSCQGFPWLLKKLCISYQDSINSGDSAETIAADLDVSKLFDSDLELLSQNELNCLKLVASKAPADWSEIIEATSVATLNALVDKRLVIKSGDRLNVYWDIFRDYFLTGQAPVVPFNYIPSSELTTMFKMSEHLKKGKLTSSSELADLTGLTEKTVWNIGADLTMFGISQRRGTDFRLHDEVESSEASKLLEVFRSKMKKHSLKIMLYKRHSGSTLTKKEILETLKDVLPNAAYSEKTWNIYSNKLIKILVTTGFLTRVGSQYTVQDSGQGTLDKSRTRNKGIVFSATASPASVCDLIVELKKGVPEAELKEAGYKNSFQVLKRFDLYTNIAGEYKLNDALIQKATGENEAIWTAAKNEVVLRFLLLLPDDLDDFSGTEVGEIVSRNFGLSWTDGSKIRNGNSLKQWALWVQEGILTSSIPAPPGRQK